MTSFLNTDNVKKNKFVKVRNISRAIEISTGATKEEICTPTTICADHHIITCDILDHCLWIQYILKIVMHIYRLQVSYISSFSIISFRKFSTSHLCGRVLAILFTVYNLSTPFQYSCIVSGEIGQVVRPIAYMFTINAQPPVSCSRVLYISMEKI